MLDVKWPVLTRRRGIVLFLLIPACINLLLIGLYFSGDQMAQYLVAPRIEWLNKRSWREFGVLEQLQNLFLLAIILLFLLQVLRREPVLERMFFFAGSLLMTFLFLEEVDYGLHFYEYSLGYSIDAEQVSRNFHNNEDLGFSLTDLLKRTTDSVMFVWFILVPLLSAKIRLGPLQSIVPSRWFVPGFCVILGFSELAHYLDDGNLDMIDGLKGALVDNISEFRETSNYYFYLLYALQLAGTRPLFNRSAEGQARA